MKNRRQPPRPPTEHSGGAIPILTPNEFAQELAGLLRQARREVKIEIVGDLELKIALPNGPIGTIHLRNAYLDYGQTPNLKDDIIAHHVSGFADALGLKPATPIERSRIIPVLEYEPRGDDQTKAAKSAEKHLTHDAEQPFSDDLVVNYVEDLPRIMRRLTNQDAVDLNLSLEELHRLAVTNVGKVLTTPDLKREGHVYRMSGAGYESSLLFYDPFWNNADSKVPGDIVVAVPARDCLLVAGSEDPEGLRQLSELAREAHDTYPHRLTCELLVRRQGKCEPYAPPPDRS